MEQKKVRVAFLSFWHTHAGPNPEVMYEGPGVYGTIQQHPDIEVITSWDDDVERGKKGAELIGVDFESDLDKILARDDIDGVVIGNETTKHLELCKKVAKAGKHIYINKILAPTIKDAKEIVKVCDENNVILVVMLSRIYEDWAIQIRKIVQSGRLGKIICMRLWHAHGIAVKFNEWDNMGYLPDGHGFYSSKDGAGGSYIDMCHTKYLTTFILEKMPKSVFGRMSSVTGKGDVEDNAVALLDYPDGPYVILEEGWASQPITSSIEVQGTDGTLLYRDDRVDPSYKFFAVRSGDDAKFKEIPLKAAEDSPLNEWIRRVRSGERADKNIQHTLDLSRLNEATYISAERNVPVDISSLNE